MDLAFCAEFDIHLLISL